jgi:hypothetical protein
MFEIFAYSPPPPPPPPTNNDADELVPAPPPPITSIVLLAEFQLLGTTQLTPEVKNTSVAGDSSVVNV